MAKLLFLWMSAFFVPSMPKSSAMHPFFTSVTEIEYNAKDKSLEVVCRIFTDDLEQVLRKNYNTKVDLFSDEYKNATTLIPAYIQKNLSVSVDGSPVKLSFIGYERKNEACWCYFEATPMNNAPKKIDITSTLMYDFTDKQFNMFHATVNGSRKSTKLDYPAAKASFEW